MDIENEFHKPSDETTNSPINLVSNENASNKNNNNNGEMAIYIGPSMPESNIQEKQGPRDEPPSKEADSEQVEIKKSAQLNPEGNQAPS